MCTLTQADPFSEVLIELYLMSLETAHYNESQYHALSVADTLTGGHTLFQGVSVWDEIICHTH